MVTKVGTIIFFRRAKRKMEGESDIRFQMDQADVIVIDLADITLQYNTIHDFYCSLIR